MVMLLRSANGDDMRQGWYAVSNLFWPSAFPPSNWCMLREKIFLKSIYDEDAPGLTKSRLKCNICFSLGRSGCISATISYLARLFLLHKVVTCTKVVIGMKDALVKVRKYLF